MSSYEDRFVKIGVVFDALYFENEAGDPPFLHSDIGNSLSDCSQSMKKICVVEVFRANVLQIQRSCFRSELFVRKLILFCSTYKLAFALTLHP